MKILMALHIMDPDPDSGGVAAISTIALECSYCGPVVVGPDDARVNVITMAHLEAHRRQLQKG